MKKIIAALAIAGFAFCSAQAQEAMRVCRKGSNNNVSCYNTKYAQNFPVCKDGGGYHICGETRSSKNSTNASVTNTRTVAVVNDFDDISSNETSRSWEGYKAQETAQEDMAPKSQSYPDYQEEAPVPYGTGYGDDRKGKVRVCYFGDNVALLGRNPYNGCPAPSYDGPEKNKTRAWSNGN